MLKTVTAIIAVYNGEKYIVSAIESILEQTIKIDEIIIIDDGSSDNTLSLLSNLSLDNMIIVSQANKGQAKSLNKAIKMANSEYLSFLDADDLWMPNKTALQLSIFEQNKNTQLCFGHVEEFISPELSEIEKQKLVCSPYPRIGKMRQAMLVKKSIFQDFGFFPELPTMDFIAWYATNRTKIFFEEIVNEAIIRRRLHATNLSRRTEKNAEIVHTFKSILQLKRKKEL